MLDGFLRDGTNKRKDEFGGNFENRTRFPLQVIDEVLKVYHANRVGVRGNKIFIINIIFLKNL